MGAVPSLKSRLGVSDRSKPCLDLDFSGHSVKQITNPHLFLEDGENMFICCLEGGGWICLGESKQLQRREFLLGWVLLLFLFLFLDNDLSQWELLIGYEETEDLGPEVWDGGHVSMQLS